MYTTAGLGLGLGLVLVYEFGLEVHEYDHLTCMLM